MPACLSSDADCYVHPFQPVYCCVDCIGHPHMTSSLPSALYPFYASTDISEPALSCEIAVLINDLLGGIGRWAVQCG